MTDSMKQKAREWLKETFNVRWNRAGYTGLSSEERRVEDMADFAAQCVAEEREACAKEMDQLAAKTDGEIADWLYSGAEVIRARGKEE